MPTRIDQVLHQVEIGGADLTAICLETRVKLGYDLKMSEADVTLTSLPDGLDYWQAVVIHAGLGTTGGDSASDQAGASTGLKRFDGFVYDFDFDLWPATVTVKCRGPLILADRLKAPDDAEATHVADADPTATPSQYDPPGIDLSVNPDTSDPWTDADMVTWILGQCGLAERIDPDNGIGGTGRILGSLAFDQFIWRRGSPGLSFIEDLDKVCLGFRTFEILGGNIVRANTSPRAPFEQTGFTLTEGTDVGFDDAPAKMNRSAQDARNRAVVSGYDVGGGPEVAVIIGASTLLPPGVLYDTEELNSPMIEKSFQADAGDGLACDEIASWLLDERTYPMMEATVPTWRDDPFSPGQVIYLNSPALAVNQSMWCKSVEIRTTGDSFTQTLTLRDRAQRDLAGNETIPGPPTAPAGLPVALAVNP